MKIKNFLGISALLLLAACSGEQPILDFGEENMSVTLTAAVGGEMETRAETAAPSGYRMRYILEIRELGTTTVTTRIVQTSPSFSFLLDKGVYDFLMWADYIESNAEDIEEDLFYDTSNLNAIIRTAEVPEANTEALDAFAAVVTKNKTSAPLEIGTVDLMRPFARINLVEKDAARLAAITKIEVDYTTEANQKFNVQTDASVTVVKGVEPVTRTILKPSNASIPTTFFFDYLFAPLTSAKTANAMTVRVYTGEADDYDLVGTVTVPAGMSYQRNKKTNLTAYYAVSETTVDMEMTAWDEAETTIDVDAIWDGTYPASIAIAELTLETAKQSVGNYEIATPEQLAAMAYLINNATTYDTYKAHTYKLMQDIDLHEHEWKPIGSTNERMFAGTFDGNGHRISGLKVSSGTFVGLFGYMNGSGSVIQYLMVEGNVSSGGSVIQYVGGIAGYCSLGTIRFCSFEGTLSANNATGNVFVGGIASAVPTATNCLSLATSIATNNCTGNVYRGGITGLGTIVNYSGYVNGTAPTVGGSSLGVGTDDFTFTSKAALLTSLDPTTASANNCNTNATDFRWIAKDGKLALEKITNEN